MTVQRRWEWEYWNLRNSRQLGKSEIHVPALQPGTCFTIKGTFILAPFLWWIFKFFGEELKADGFCFCCSTGKFCSMWFFNNKCLESCNCSVCTRGCFVTSLCPDGLGCFHQEDTCAELWLDATSVPFCLFLGNANWSPCARMWWDQTAGGCPHAAPNLLFLVLLQDVPHVCFIPCCSCPLFSIK